MTLKRVEELQKEEQEVRGREEELQREGEEGDASRETTASWSGCWGTPAVGYCSISSRPRSTRHTRSVHVCVSVCVCQCGVVMNEYCINDEWASWSINDCCIISTTMLRDNKLMVQWFVCVCVCVCLVLYFDSVVHSTCLLLAFSHHTPRFLFYLCLIIVLNECDRLAWPWTVFTLWSV